MELQPNQIDWAPILDKATDDPYPRLVNIIQERLSYGTLLKFQLSMLSEKPGNPQNTGSIL